MNSRKTQPLFIAICISLMVLPSTVAFPAYSYNNGNDDFLCLFNNNLLGYSILDLDANDATYFGTEASNFACATLATPGVKTTKCNGYYLLGGYLIFSSSNGNTIGQNFARIYSGLQPHNMIYFAFTLYEIDSWDGNDYMTIQFDNTAVKSTWYSPFGIAKTDYCANPGWRDIIDNHVFGKVVHSALTLKLQFISGLDEDAGNESAGYRDLSLIFATTSASTATTQSICVIPTVAYTNGLCGCSEGYYLSGSSCLPCNSLCDSCFGPAATDCYVCASGAGWNGIACIACHSSCAACYGPADTQCTTCPSGYVMYKSKYCIPQSYCKSPLTVSSPDAYNYVYCPSVCGDSQFIMWDGSCSSNCSSPLKTSTMTSYLQYCIYPCATSKYLYWDGTCGATCNFPLGATVVLTKNFCNFPCSTGQFLYWNGTCASSCDYPLTSSLSNGQNFCTYPCTNSQYLSYNATCLTSCSSPLVTRVEAGLNYCDYSCASNQFLYWDGTCQSSCAAPLVAATYGAKQFCKYPCLTSQFLYWNGTCASSCNYPLKSTVSNGQNFCIYPCTSSEYLYYNATCGTSCSSPLVTRLEATLNYCDYPCASDQYLYWDGTCQTDCDFPLVPGVISSKSFCYYPCSTLQTLYWNGTCASSCVYPLTPSISDGRIFCTYSCLSSQYLYFNGSCKGSCPLPLLTRVEAGSKYCDYPCAISEFLYMDSSCASYCVAPFASRKEAARNYCYRLCPEPQFLLWNGSCIADCNSPLRIRTNTSGTYCLFPCDNITEYYHTGTRTCEPACNAPDIPTKHMYLECLPGNIPAVTFSKLLHHIRYLDIPMPQELKNITIAREMNILSLRTSRGLFTKQVKHSLESNMPHIFQRNNPNGSFLTNFMQDLFTVLVIVGSGVLSLIFEKASAWRGLPRLQAIFHKYRTLALWNLLLILITTDIGDIIFFSTIEFRTYKLMTTWSTVSLVASNIVLIGVFMCPCYHRLDPSKVTKGRKRQGSICGHQQN